MINIFIIDDHPLFREGLKQVLSEASYITIVDETGSPTAVLNKVMENDYDMVILDVSMPEINGFNMLKRIKKCRPDLPILIISAHSEEQYALHALKYGASGYLTKESIPDELIKAIRKISIGGKYVSTSITQKLKVHRSVNSLKIF